MTDTFSFLHALQIVTERVGAVAMSLPLVFADVLGDFELLSLEGTNKYLTKVHAWNLYFRVGKREYVAITVHRTDGIVRAECFRNIAADTPIQCDQIRIDNIPIQNTFLANGANVGRQDCRWSLLVLPIHGVPRPVWVTPFALGGRTLIVDAETGQVWERLDEDVLQSAKFVIDEAIQAPVGNVRTFITGGPAQLVNLSDFASTSHPQRPEEIRVWLERIREQANTMRFG